ncbi:MAG TPA: Gfo/Idh/MocA family oxidoreductase [Ilumatobacteraceae bacterium]|nr:Gfo/Idh/MocA family oxidoreductase [Ilumatobacteraceae bacterium]HRB01918.1 Gfo/Idh/MocA family oxidoreductase [Ilumatobacteraceae bacterium]
MTDQTLRIGVCGLGSIGRRHARLLASRKGVTVHVFDPGLALDDSLEADVGTVMVEPSYEALLESARDGVVIATPDALHAPLTIQACRAGRPVLVEKPVAETSLAAQAMDAVSIETGVAVLVGQVLRYSSVMIRARELLHASAIGVPLSFHATVGAYETLEMARTRFREEATYRLPFDYVHEWDYLQWLLGNVTGCTAVGHLAANLELVQMPNVIDVLLTMDTFVTGTAHLNYVERHGGRMARIVGDRGVLEVDLRAGTIALSDREGNTSREDHSEHRDAAFNRQLDHFIDITTNGAAVGVPVAVAGKSVAVAEAIVAACKTGQWQRLDS